MKNVLPVILVIAAIAGIVILIFDASKKGAAKNPAAETGADAEAGAAGAAAGAATNVPMQTDDSVQDVDPYLLDLQTDPIL